MNNIFEIAAFCLQQDGIDEKLRMTQQARTLLDAGELSFAASETPLPISCACFPKRPQLRDPRVMPKRKFSTEAGKAAFFHALAHIEFMAIYLAWDIIYRFRGLPEAFYRDWLRVADEEALHFSMIRRHLQQFNLDYGDLPAHSGLWDVAEDTADDPIARLALVPRYMEARGLDVTPPMIAKFKALNDRQSVELLQRILADEIGHVQRGSYWFDVLCKQRGLAPEVHYQFLLNSRLKGQPRGQLNRALRKQAGFSDAELDWLEITYHTQVQQAGQC